ncbi:MAG: type I-E CRISPR-associated protein Cas5/CasD [Thermoleophilia bacterium]
MPELLLLLRLEGPLQSWGLRARWDVRDTADEPSKSGIIGLLGCALGYPVGDRRLETLEKQTRLAVRVEREGTRLVDFHTVTGVLPRADGGFKGNAEDPATILSSRSYLEDAAFLAVVAGPVALLEKCADALRTPAWPIYLGRKSCPPSRPVFEGITRDYGSVREAVSSCPWGFEASDDSVPERLRCVLEDPECGHATRTDALRSNPARMYGERRVSVFWVDTPKDKEVDPCSSPD